MNGSSSSEFVTLVVKSPNQPFTDQRIQCQVNWSIKQLKEHLSEVYPSKPKFEDQRLIYSGKLLTDTSVVKDILRTYEGQENHTVHLVCKTPFSKEKNTTQNNRSQNSSSSAEGRQVPEGVAFLNNDSTNGRLSFNANQNYVANWTQFATNFGDIDPRMLWPNINNPSDVQQHYVMMQQMYAQYMSQYMQMAAGQFEPSNIAFPLQPPSNFDLNNLQGQDQLANNNPIPAQNDRGAVARNRAGQFGEGEEQEDWLDYLSTFARVILLLSIVYFYSSPFRFLCVVVLIVFMYIYQIGYFGQFANRQLFVNNNNNNNVNFVNNYDNNGNENVNNNVENNAENRTVEPTENPVENNPENVVENRQNETVGQQAPNQVSAFGLAWMIIRSFFLSLIPEQPNAI